MKHVVVILMTLILNACATGIQQYQNNKPAFSLKQFFSGPMTAHGIIKNRSGDVIRYFNVRMLGYWNDQGVGILEEDFRFNDGKRQQRTWTFTPDSNGNYLATAPDVIGKVPVEISGNAFHMNYTLVIEYDGEPLAVNVNDRLYQVNDSVLINESVMSKYGFDVGYITLTIIR